MARVRHRLKLMADYQCFPLWWHGGRLIGMIEPDALPLSEELKRRLSAWAAVYDGLTQTDYQWPTAAAQTAFVRDGRVLLAALREELMLTRFPGHLDSGQDSPREVRDGTAEQVPIGVSPRCGGAGALHR